MPAATVPETIARGRDVYDGLRLRSIAATKLLLSTQFLISGRVARFATIQSTIRFVEN